MPKHRQRDCRPGFTLIELMVVVGILVALITILLPTLGYVRDIGRTTQCASGMRQWGMAVNAYVIDSRQRLPWEGTFGSNVTRYKNGVKVTGLNGNTEGDAWYNALPHYVNAPTYGEIYDGNATPNNQVTTLGQLDNGYKNAWIWYCPSRILLKKNSGTNKNSAQYAMNAVLNGTGTYGPDYGSHANGDLEFNSISTIPRLECTPFLIESDQNTAAESPVNVATTRHGGGHKTNVLFLDNHVDTLLDTQVPTPTTATTGWCATNDLWISTNPLIIWGPWKK